MATKKPTDADKRYIEMMSKKKTEVPSTPLPKSEEVVFSQDAEDNRAKFPDVAKFVDEVRKYFPDAKVTSITPIKDKEKKDNG